MILPQDIAAARSIRIVVDAGSIDLDEWRDRLARWCPEARVASDEALCAAIADAIADDTNRRIVLLRTGAGQQEADLRAAIRRHALVFVEVV